MLLSIVTNSLIIIGSAFVCIAAIGVYRFPDFYTRMHAATKAGAFGGTLLAIAAGFAIGGVMTWLQVVFVIAFFYFTTPVAAHLLGRAGYLRKVPFYSAKKK